MATAIHSSSPFHATHPHRPFASYDDYSSQSASQSSTLMTSTDDELHSDQPRSFSMPSGARKIRFAPLPDPRRAVLVTDDGDELPLSSNHDGTPAAIPAYDAKPSRSPLPPMINILPSSPCAPTPVSSSQQSKYSPDTCDSPQEESPKRSRGFLSNPFSKRSSSPSSFNFSTEELLTLGTINLFRTSSRDSRRSVESAPSTLSRWTSNTAKSFNKHRKTPGKHSQSMEDLPSSNNPRSSEIGAGGGRSKAAGIRMLNGRVYGKANRKYAANTNLFATARDEEPKFVEWGYGGMGSVKNAAHGGSSIAWNKVQSGGTGLHHEEDDGSGLAWVKKRREEKERKAREAKDKENQKLEQPSSQDTAEPPPSKEADATTTTTTTTPGDGTPREQSDVPARDGEHHVLSAVNVPAPFRHHPHGHSRSSSNAGSAVHLVNHTAEIKDTHPIDEVINSDMPTGSESSASSSSSDTDSEDDDEENDADDDEDDEEAEANRLTALGAGVEKISRHKDP